MEYLTVFPYRKYRNKRIRIKDLNDVRVGFIQRTHNSFWDRLLTNIPIPFLHKANVYGESGQNKLHIVERIDKDNKKKNWDVVLNDEEKILLENRTQIATHIRFIYHKNNKEFLFKRDASNRTCEVSINGMPIKCAEITLERAPASLRVKMDRDDLTPLELLAVYYIIYLVYL